ncbi:hypothetical protein Moror_17776 [Moniliophthora roreri MCA 2997]|uniref:Uncharacterized protein n=1 Tax=Moniliophthora roreri (strain MCA 2997) TaxID=1381753 RepID=V2XXS2_MONRO|nr:hypothetical protein Moror_17776 [Moniliophthora roreri MCA 2997]
MIAQEMHNFHNTDIDICELLRTMSLREQKFDNFGNTTQRVFHPAPVEDELMSDGTQSDTASECSSSNTHLRSETYGCAYLKALQAQLDCYPTTGGEYLEAIFTHREILFAYPSSHQECARAFSDIAFQLEHRAWRADRDADTEAVMAFRHEAWMIAAKLQPHQKQDERRFDSDVQHVSNAPIRCVMQPVF